MESSSSPGADNAAINGTVIAAAPPGSVDSNSQGTLPYWLGRARTISSLSYRSVSGIGKRAGIALEDNSNPSSDVSKGLWAKSVSIEDHTVVEGQVMGVGAYVVWNCTVLTIDGGSMKIRKRYSEFDDLRRRLAQSFPSSEAAMPLLPPKSLISKFRPKFLEQRRAGLSYFLNCILLHPDFAASPVLKEFLFSIQ